MLARRTHGSSSDDAHPTQSVNEIWYRRATRIPCRSAIRPVDWHDLRAWVDIVRCPHRTAARTPHCTPSTKRRNAARRPASQTTPDRVLFFGPIGQGAAQAAQGAKGCNAAKNHVTHTRKPDQHARGNAPWVVTSHRYTRPRGRDTCSCYYPRPDRHARGRQRQSKGCIAPRSVKSGAIPKRAWLPDLLLTCSSMPELRALCGSNGTTPLPRPRERLACHEANEKNHGPPHALVPMGMLVRVAGRRRVQQRKARCLGEENRKKSFW